jgi:hypothetical protein
MSVNDDLFARAQRSIPGGVNSPVRAFRSVGGTPRFLVSANGAYVTDAEAANMSTSSHPGVRRFSGTRILMSWQQFGMPPPEASRSEHPRRAKPTLPNW